MGDKQDSEKFRNFALAFLREAKEDLESAEDLLDSERYSRVVFFCQQAVEKSVKALLEMEHIFVAEHDLSSFFVKFIYNNKDYNEFKEKINLLFEIIDFFEGEAGKTRYPKEKGGKVVTPTEIYKIEDASSSLDKGNEAYSIVRQIFIKKFKFKESEI